MKTDEPRRIDEQRSRSAGPSGEEKPPVREPAQENGEAWVPGAAASEQSGEEAPARAALTEVPTTKRSYVLRFVYWLVWFVLLPVVLASFVVWALTPAGSAEPGGILGWAESLVRAQPVPVGIVLFTFFEVLLWSTRHRLPFSSHADPPVRSDLPQHLRGPFDRARAIIDEAEMILEKHQRAVVRELTAKEREKVRKELVSLRLAMDSVPFDEDEFIDAVARAEGEIDAGLGRWRKSEVREYVEAILMAVAVAFALRTFVVEAFKIPSGSMIPTLMVGDHIFVNKFSYGPAIPYTHSRVWTSMPPKRGDVMVFAFPEHPEQDFIKRVIMIEGDKLEARGGHPIINGWEVPNCRVGTWTYSDYDSPARHEGELFVEYLGDESYLTFYDRASGMFPEYQGPYFAKRGEVWVMGDNRNNSHDSRMWFGGRGGGVPFENIRGRALFVWLSVSDNGMDWSREGAPVMGRPRLPPTAAVLEPQLDRCLKNRPAVTLPPPLKP
ncbi:MAG: signal peptidase I [Polyangiaceae bacterium]